MAARRQRDRRTSPEPRLAIEQMPADQAALKLADRAFVLETGRVLLSGAARDLKRDPRVKDGYLGAGAV